jgi:type I restriction enzyme S subunit
MMSRLVPKLRFKEFGGEWKEKKLSMVSNITTGGSNREDSTENDGEYTFFDRSEDVRTSARYLFNDEAIIIAGEGQKFTPKYYKGKFDLHQRTYAILELQIIGKFLYYYIDKCKDYFLQNAVGSTVKSLRLPMFQQMPVLLPILTEQQKIASCLSSLDSLIEAQNKKVSALKQHKKGLMQQLFPAEGEREPKLRFKAFSGEWDGKKLKDCLDYLQPTKYLVSSTTYDDKYKTPVLTAGKTFILGFTDETNGIFKDNLPVIIFDDFTTATKFVDFPFKAKSSAMKILLAREKTNIKFIYEAIQTIKYEVGNHERHWISKFAVLNILAPKPKEQQKIANTLSTLDNLIEAQNQQINHLKQHKKGLMQQMFVSSEVGV